MRETTIRIGDDSVSVINVFDVDASKWRSMEDVQATLADPDAQGYAKRTGELARPSPHVYSVVSIHHP